VASEVLPPSRYSESAAAKYVAEHRAKQQQLAMRSPILAYPTEIAVCGPDGDIVLHVRSDATDTTRAARTFCEFLATEEPSRVFRLGDVNSACRTKRWGWFGFDIRTNMPLIAMTVMGDNGDTQPGQPRTPIPSQMWYSPQFTASPFVDLYEALVPSALRTHVDLRALCEHLSVSYPTNVADSAVAMASLSCRLYDACGLNTDDDT
jgi:hypothetical protein